MFNITSILFVKFSCIRIYPKVNEIRENVIEIPFKNTVIHLKYCNIYFDRKITPDSQPYYIPWYL